MTFSRWLVALTCVFVCGCRSEVRQPVAEAPESGIETADEDVSHAIEETSPDTDPASQPTSKPNFSVPDATSEPNPSTVMREKPESVERPEVQDARGYEPWRPESDFLKRVQAIHERPWDEQAVLDFADWLKPTDPARAQLVRAQVELTKIDYSDPRSSGLAQQVRLLTEQNRQRWTEALGALAEQASLRFGIVDGLTISEATDEQIQKVLSSAPELRVLNLNSPRCTAAGYNIIAKFPTLDALTIEAEAIPASAIPALSALPPWTVVHLYVADLDYDQLAEMNATRIGRVLNLSPEERMSAACRFLAQHDYRTRFGEPTKHANLSQAGVGDAEMQLLAGLPNLETVYISESDVTSKGIAHLAGLTELTDLGLWDTKVESIAALSGLTKLEKLGIYPEFDTVMGDEGLAAIENFTQLKEVYLSDEEITDKTVKLFANSTAMEKLELTVGRLEDDNSLSALSGMSQLKLLSFSGGSMSDAALKHLAGLGNLETLTISIERGNGEGFRHLADLQKLRYLNLSGDGVNDKAMAQLAGLVDLKTIMAQGSAVTQEGAKRLAAQLKHVTIILDDHVVKTPHDQYVFTRHRFSDTVSILLPKDWLQDERGSSDYLLVGEDGWERIGGWSGDQVGPCQINLYFDTESETPRDAMMASVNNNSHLNPKILRQDVQALGDQEASASCIYVNDFRKHFIGAVEVDGKMLVLDCEAIAPRFDAYEAMFLFIARSVRIGNASDLHADQTVELKAEEVMPKGIK